MIHNGSCHCGSVAYTVEGDIQQAMECNCSHCRRKGYMLWFASRDKLKFTSPETALATYTFNKHAIQHQFCSKCGCAPFGFGKDKEGRDTVAVNVRCLPDVEFSSLKIIPVDGKSF